MKRRLLILNLLIATSLLPYVHETGEILFIKNIWRSIPLNLATVDYLYGLAQFQPSYPASLFSMNEKNLPFFKEFPYLLEYIPFISLCDVQTPIIRLDSFTDACNVYLKNDGIPGINGKFGGNKRRKAEFLLGHASQNFAASVITWGCAGSNHAVATAAYAKYLGLECHLFLKPQPNSHVVRKNLLLMQHYGAHLHFCTNNKDREDKTIKHFVEQKFKHGLFPYFIQTGGSNPVGILGFVNAAFELKEQIERGEIPMPDYIYVAAGSFGTLSGLLLGCKLAGLDIKILAVSVEPEEFPGQFTNVTDVLFRETLSYLRSFDESIPVVQLCNTDFTFIHDFAGTDYGLFTKEACAAIKLLAENEHIILDGTYTGKAFAALLHDLETKKELVGKNILFWNTYCAETFEDKISFQQYKNLPAEFHKFFEQDVQELDTN